MAIPKKYKHLIKSKVVYEEDGVNFRNSFFRIDNSGYVVDDRTTEFMERMEELCWKYQIVIKPYNESSLILEGLKNSFLISEVDGDN